MSERTEEKDYEALHKSQESANELVRQRLLKVLCDTEDFLGGLGEDFAFENSRTCELKRRLTHERFHLAVLGQFKRGKTTLINALLGDALLPTAVVPITSVPTLLLWGDKRAVRINFQEGYVDEHRPEDSLSLARLLEKYVSERENPGNRLRVAQVEVEHPSPWLATGTVLIDTPGIGSTLTHNSETTLDFLHQCDAALFLISADPPITQAELDFLRAVRSKVAHIFFVMNKVDYLSNTEKRDAEEFFKKVLLEQGYPHIGENGRIFNVSARQGLEAKLKGDDALWQKSGMAELESHLMRFLVQKKAQTLYLAVSKKCQEVLADALTSLHLEQRALELPLSDLEQRMAVFAQKLQEAEKQRLVVQDLLSGELRRSTEFLEQQAAQLREKAYEQLSNIIDKMTQEKGNPKSLEKSVRTHLAETAPEMFQSLLDQTAQDVQKFIQASLEAHRNQATALITGVRKAAAEIFEVPHISYGDAEVLHIRHKPFWITEEYNLAIGLVPEGALDKFLPRAILAQRLKRRLERNAQVIVLRNVENLRWTLLQTIEDVFRNFASDMDQQLTKAIEATKGAIAAAYNCRIERASEVELERKRLSRFEQGLRGLQKELAVIEGLLGGQAV